MVLIYQSSSRKGSPGPFSPEPEVKRPPADVARPRKGSPGPFIPERMKAAGCFRTAIPRKGSPGPFNSERLLTRVVGAASTDGSQRQSGAFQPGTVVSLAHTCKGSPGPFSPEPNSLNVDPRHEYTSQRQSGAFQPGTNQLAANDLLASTSQRQSGAFQPGTTADSTFRAQSCPSQRQSGAFQPGTKIVEIVVVSAGNSQRQSGAFQPGTAVPVVEAWLRGHRKGSPVSCMLERQGGTRQVRSLGKVVLGLAARKCSPPPRTAVRSHAFRNNSEQSRKEKGTISRQSGAFQSGTRPPLFPKPGATTHQRRSEWSTKWNG